MKLRWSDFDTPLITPFLMSMDWGWKYYNGTIAHKSFPWKLITKLFLQHDSTMENSRMHVATHAIPGGHDYWFKASNAIDLKKIACQKHYNSRTAIHSSHDWQRLIVFDIDHRKYRTCACQRGETCSNCWKFVEAAYLILVDVMVVHLHFQKPLVVFSGGDGAHFWFAIPSGGDYDPRASYSRADVRSNILKRYRDSNRNKMLRSKVMEMTGGIWPELDGEPTTGTTHCIKLPFSVHGGTGRIALPLPYNEHGEPIWDEKYRNITPQMILQPHQMNNTATKCFISSLKCLNDWNESIHSDHFFSPSTASVPNVGDY